MMKRLGLVWTTVMLLAAGHALVAAESPWETIEWGRMNQSQRFKWALDLYRMDRAEDSAEMLSRVIASAPEPRKVAELADMLGPRLRAAMLADEKTTKAVQEWVKLYQSAIEKLRRDDAYVSEMVGGLAEDGPDREVYATRLEQVQEFAVPHVIHLMAQAGNEKGRVIGRRMLLRLRRVSVLPTVEYLESPDDTLRIVLLGVLGELKDVRAQAAVCRVAVDRQAEKRVRQAAMDALLSIIHQPRAGLALAKNPAVNYWRLAHAYLHEAPFALPTMDGDELPVWKWSAEKNAATYTMVPRRLYNEELADEACFDGLAINKNDIALRSMAIAVSFSKKLELLDAKDAKVERALEMAILVGGKRALQRCMAQALADGDLGIAILAAQTLGKVGAGKGFTVLEEVETANPLLAALTCEDRAVRFAAARAVVACQPKAGPMAVSLSPRPGGGRMKTGAFDNYRQVLPALSWGLMYDMPGRTVLIIHPDTGTINYYKGELRSLGHTVVDATDLSKGMLHAASLPRPDVVLLSAEFVKSLEGVRSILGSRRIPIVLLVTPEQKQAFGENADVLVGHSGVDNLKLVLGRLLEVPEKKVVAQLIPGISARAASSLAEVVPAATPLPMSSVVPALRRVLTSEDDAVRLPALRALGNIAPPDAALDVLAVAANKRTKKEVRLAALDALAKILEAQREVPPDVFVDLVPLSSEDDAEISLAAARAISVAKFDPGQFADLMVLKRVQAIQSGARP